MKRNNSKLLFYIFCTSVFFAASCTHNSLDYPVGESNSRSLFLQISTDSDYSTRSTEKETSNLDAATNENKIERLDLFFYQGNQLKWHAENVTYDPISKNVEIALSEKAESLFNGVKKYDLYVVANGPIRNEITNKTLSELKNIVHTADYGLSKQEESPRLFLMDGKMIGKAVSLTNTELGTINMKRAAAKIRVRIFKGSKIMGTEFTPYIAVKNYNKKTALLQNRTVLPTDLFSDKEYTKAETEYTTSSLALPGLSHLPIYSYENDWSKAENKENETYIMIRVDYKKTASSAKEEYFYKVPINAATKSTDSGKKLHCIERNHIYDIKVTIDELSGTEEKPLLLNGNYQIKNWTTKEVALDVTEHHFLFVDPQKAEMKNTTQQHLSFSSSRYPVWIKDVSITYSYVDAATGKAAKITIHNNNLHYPLIQLIPRAQLINIESMIPENNVPKDIVFTLTNGIKELDQKVHIRQYPPVYITNEMGISSYWRENANFVGEDHLNNAALYIYNTILPDGNTIIGFPPVDEYGCTLNTEEVAKMVSPSFMGASELGATSIYGYDSARENCWRYWEKNSAGVIYDDWRLPTEAEIALMDRLQHDQKSAVRYIMTGDWYWDSYSGNNAYQMIGTNIPSIATATSAHIRCVRDVKN